MIKWPGKIILTGITLAAIGASVALRTKWRNAPLVIGTTTLTLVFLWAAFRYGSDASGLRIAGLPFALAVAVLIIAAIALSAMQLWKLASSPRLPRWVRFIPAAVALYAAGLIVVGITRGGAPASVLAGDGPVPWWMSGAYLGGAVLLPLGLLISLVLLTLALIKKRAAIMSALAVVVMMMSAVVLSGLELTRSARPNLAQFVLPSSIVGASSTGALQAGAASTNAAGAALLGPGDESLAPYEGKDLDEIFGRVSTGVRYEPYAGILRGATGTAIARSANSADRSLLLAEVLRRAGYKVRFARGQLDDANVTTLVRGMYPPYAKVEQLPAEYAPYDPVSDTQLRDLIRDHVWVEVFQGETWLPLDASFPRAKIGESYAQSSEQFDAPPDAMFHRIEAVVKAETANGQSQDIGRFSGTVADLGMKPISLVVRAIPQSTGGESQQSTGSPAGQVGGMGDALGGGTEAPPPEPPKKTEKQIVGVAYVRDMNVAGVPQKVQRTTVRNGDAGSALKRESIEFVVTAPGGQQRTVERVLYQVDEQSKVPSLERRYTISILSGRIPRSFADAQTALANSLLDVRTMEKEASRLAKTSADDPRARDAAVQVGKIGDALGSTVGHLLALRFAAESDSLSRRIADGTGVALAWSTPRIIIVGTEITGKDKGAMDAKVSLDLRLDEIQAYPYPSAPSRIVPVFHLARGIQESVIEGRLVSLATGKTPAANTAQLVSAAQKQKVELLVINSSTRAQLAQIAPGVPATCVQLMDAALAKGKEIVLPSRAITVEGKPQWGWWEVDPSTGQVIGVMESGEHQGMAEYSINSEEIGLNDESGQVLGMMMGSITTMGTLSALILKYGSATPELIKELEAFLTQLLCNSCIESAGVKAGVGAEVSAGGGNECYTASQKFGGKVEVGAEIKNGFCEAYGKGFKCASGLILRALKDESLISAAKVEIKFTAESEAKIGCTDVGG